MMGVFCQLQIAFAVLVASVSAESSPYGRFKYQKPTEYKPTESSYISPHQWAAAGPYSTGQTYGPPPAEIDEVRERWNKYLP